MADRAAPGCSERVWTRRMVRLTLLCLIEDLYRDDHVSVTTLHKKKRRISRRVQVCQSRREEGTHRRVAKSEGRR